MIRLTMAAVTVAVLAFAAPAQAQMSGKILCEQDAQEIRQHLQARKAQLSQEQYTSALKRLDTAEDQCGNDASGVTQRLAVLRREMGMQPMDPQAAQMPKR